MLEPVRYWYRSVRRHVRRTERRELRELQRWLEDTQNMLHLSALVLVPLLIGVMTFLSNVSPAVSFLVYPPLASGTYTLFADPDGRYSEPKQFVAGMTLGAFSGWVALEVTAQFWYTVPPAQFQVHAGAAALGIFLTGLSTWAFSVEEPTAYSSALLVLLTGSEELTYVAGITVSSVLVASVFSLWRTHFYRERARYLFQSTRGDDQILVPIRESTSESHILFAARLAAAHDSGKIVLVDTVRADVIAEAESKLAANDPDRDEESTADAGPTTAEEQLTAQRLEQLEAIRDQLTEFVDVPCEFVVAVAEGSPGATVLETAAVENCDLIVFPYETTDDGLSEFARTILSGHTDAVAFRPSNGRTEWHRILVMVRSPGQIANAMLDFANRLLSPSGRISACTCISTNSERRRAEIDLENLVESVPEPIETRIGHGSVEEFLQSNTPHYDLAVVGAGTDRYAASRLLSVPTYERIRDVECDLAIVHSV